MRRILAIAILFFAVPPTMKAEPPPQFQRVHGEYQVTHDWRITLPEDYAKRFETGDAGTDLVLWKAGVTCWIRVYDRKQGETPAATYAWIKQDASKEAIQTFERKDDTPLRFGYLLREKPRDDPERWALYTYTIGESGHVMMAIYFDDQQDIETAKKIWFSVAETR